MSIVYKIPHQSRLIATGNIFTSTFNNPAIGKYDFNVSGNQNQKVCDLLKGSVYLIERISIGANISEEIFTNSINTVPQLTFRRKVLNENVYKLPIPVVGFSDNTQITCWINSKFEGDELYLSCIGLLNQIPATVGKLTITLNIGLQIYAIESTQFQQDFDGDLDFKGLLK
jgi:hypothetical protein